MSMSSTPPETVYDPTQVSQQQTQANSSAQASSNYNQVTPYGSVAYNQTGTSANGTPIYTATTTLSPQQQAVLDAVQGNTAGLLQNANYGGSNPAATVGNATSGTTQDLLHEEVGYLSPFFGQQTELQDTQLKNEGLTPSDPAYKTAMNNLQVNQDQSVENFLATAEPQAYAQSVSSYELPATTANLIAPLEGEVQNPNANGAPTTAAQPANVTGAYATAQQAQQAAQQQATANQDAMLSGVFGIGSSVAGGLAKNSAVTGGLGSGLASIGSGIGSFLSALGPVAPLALA